MDINFWIRYGIMAVVTMATGQIAYVLMQNTDVFGFILMETLCCVSALYWLYYLGATLDKEENSI